MPRPVITRSEPATATARPEAIGSAFHEAARPASSSPAVAEPSVVKLRSNASRPAASTRIEYAEELAGEVAASVHTSARPSSEGTAPTTARAIGLPLTIFPIDPTACELATSRKASI